MKAKIIRAYDSIAISKGLLADPKVSLAAKGAVGALLALDDSDYSVKELSALIGVRETELITCLNELISHGYACSRDGIFILMCM